MLSFTIMSYHMFHYLLENCWKIYGNDKLQDKKI